MKTYRVCIVGATGAVGQAFIDCLAGRKFPLSELVLFASKRSAGKKLDFRGTPLEVRELTAAGLQGFDFALFSAGSSVSKEFAPVAAKGGAVVIDNSSAFRMDKDVPLVVPEVNPGDIDKHKGIIANPNCSTIQMVVALKPIHDRAKVKRIVVATYQAISGAGSRAIHEAREEAKVVLGGGSYPREIFPRQIAFNVIPQIPQKDAFLPDGYTVEELKMVNETKKIMGDPAIKVNATCVRVAVINGHSESINIETEKKISAEEACRLLAKAPGVILCKAHDRFPTPAEISGRGEVFVGRVREDDTVPNGLTLWVVADNILKGAALNAVQIAECMIKAV